MISHSILIKEHERPIQRCPAPPLPSEALALAGSRQVAPNLLLYPVSDIRETPARVADGKVLHPAPQDRIDLLDQLPHGLRAIASEDGLELAQQGRSLLASRRIQRHPSSPTTTDPTELKAQKSETLSLLKIHPPVIRKKSVWGTFSLRPASGLGVLRKSRPGQPRRLDGCPSSVRHPKTGRFGATPGLGLGAPERTWANVARPVASTCGLRALRADVLCKNSVWGSSGANPSLVGQFARLVLRARLGKQS